MGKYVVTGGSGFVGRALVKKIRDEGHEAIIATRTRPEGSDEDYWIEYDLRDRSTVANVIQSRPDGIFHLAWSTTPASAEADPAADIQTNLVGTVDLFASVARLLPVPIVFSSSGGTVYGPSLRLPVAEDHPLAPIGAYGATKAAAENYASILRRISALDVRIVRLSNPFGLHQSSAKMQGAASIFAKKIVNNEAIGIWGDGSVTRDYVHVDDATAAIFSVMQMSGVAASSDSTFNVGSGEGMTLLELIDVLAKAARVEPHLSFGPARRFDISSNILDIQRIRAVTGWKPALTTKVHLTRLVDTIRNLEGP